MAHASQVKNVFSWEWEDDGGSAQPLLGLRPSRPLPPHPPKSQQADPRTWCVTFWCLPLHSLTLLCPVQPKRECPSHSSPIQSGVSGVGIWGWGGGICGQAYTLSPVTLVSSCTTDSACVCEGIPHAMPEPLCKVQRGLNWFLLPLNKVLSPCTLHTCGFKDSDNVLPLPLTWVSNNSTNMEGRTTAGRLQCRVCELYKLTHLQYLWFVHKQNNDHIPSPNIHSSGAKSTFRFLTLSEE